MIMFNQPCCLYFIIVKRVNISRKESRLQRSLLIAIITAQGDHLTFPTCNVMLTTILRDSKENQSKYFVSVLQRTEKK